VIVYFTNWAQYRPCSAYTPENLVAIAPKLTHIHYAFAQLDASGNVSPTDPSDCPSGMWKGCGATQQDALFTRVQKVKQQFPHLKILITIGGWSFGGGVACPFFSKMAASTTSRSNFVKQAVSYAKTFGFDGIEIDWEFPGATDLGCSSSDPANFVSLMQELRQAMGNNMTLSFDASADAQNIQNSRLTTVYQYLDFINVMTYDYSGADWSTGTGLVAPLYDPVSHSSVNDTINYLLSLGIPPKKINMGMASYGASFDVSGRAAPYPIGTPFHGAGKAGPCTQGAGEWAYFEIVQMLQQSGSVSQYSTADDGPYAWAQGGNPWVGYDNVRSVTDKMGVVNHLGLGGVMVWTVDMDDFANGYPLISAMASNLNQQ